jgi:glucose/arabinose dehydrogenase
MEAALRRIVFCLVACGAAAVHSQLVAREGTAAAAALAVQAAKPSAIGSAVDKLDGPVFVMSDQRRRLRVVPVAGGLSHPWGMTFLPDGAILVTERAGRLRLVKDGVLDPTPIAGVPPVNNVFLGGLLDIALHPDFARTRFVYLSYSKDGPRGVTLAVARGRYDAKALTDVKDIFVAEAWGRTGDTSSEGGATYAGRILFGPDGMLYVTVGDRDEKVLTDDPSLRLKAQALDNHIGKVLRLRDDGSVPADNPFVKDLKAKGEIYTFGHRNPYGLAFHPPTGNLYESEFGPLGGDEINLLRPGRNYGWPLVSLGRNYSGLPVSDQSWWRAGLEMPAYYWSPSFNPSNMFFYTGRKFAGWRNSLVVAGLGSKHLQRLTVTPAGVIMGRPESMLRELDIRFRDVRQGPDEFLYVLTERRTAGNEDTDGLLLRIEPAPAE